MPPDLRWTLADLEDIETLAGIDFADLAAEIDAATMGRKLRICAALIYVQERKTNPAVTFDEVRDLTGPEVLVRAEPLLSGVMEPAPLPA